MGHHVLLELICTFQCIREGLKIDRLLIFTKFSLKFLGLFSEKLFPSGIDRGVFRFMMLGMTLFLTMMCLYEPEVNHNALHLFAIPCVGYTVYKVSEKGL